MTRIIKIKNDRIFPLVLVFILLNNSCNTKNLVPEKFKKGLVEFYAKPNKIEEYLKDIHENNSLEFGDLWLHANKINIKTNADTIIADVNVYINKNLNYDGGCEFSKDTLYLYAKAIDFISGNEDYEAVTFHYKILKQGRHYKKVEFNMLK